MQRSGFDHLPVLGPPAVSVIAVTVLAVQRLQAIPEPNFEVVVDRRIKVFLEHACLGRDVSGPHHRLGTSQ